jgi:hypothetical protein
MKKTQARNAANLAAWPGRTRYRRAARTSSPSFHHFRGDKSGISGAKVVITDGKMVEVVTTDGKMAVLVR